MLNSLSQRVAWICLLLFSSAVCFPAADDYQYPYTDASSDSSPDQLSVAEPASESTMETSADVSPRSGIQQPAAQQAGAQNQGPAASSAASWTSYQPTSYVSPTSKPARVLQSSAGASSGSPTYNAPAGSYGGFGGYRTPTASHGSSGAYVPKKRGSGATSGHRNILYHSPASSHGGFRGYGAHGGSYGGSGSHYAADPEGYSSGGTLVYSGGAPSFRFEGSLGNEYAELPRVGFESFNPNSWMPSRSFPDFSIWGPEEVADGGFQGGKGGKGVKGVQQEEEEVETFSVPASSYIIQTRNGYQRAREVSSHMNYSPVIPEPAVIYYEVKQRVVQDEPVKGGKGGKQIGL